MRPAREYSGQRSGIGHGLHFTQYVEYFYSIQRDAVRETSSNLATARTNVFLLIALRRKMSLMKLAKSNPFLRSTARADALLWISAKTSSAIEGIRQPFANGRNGLNVSSTEALIDYWKKRSSASGR